MNPSSDHRIAGVLAPLFALRTENDLGIGDLDALRQFIDWAEKTGFQLVQLLPINETGRDNSPYNAISSVAIDPMTLHLACGSPEDLTREDFDATLAKFSIEKLRSGNVNYRRVRQLKQELLEKAFARFQDRAQQNEAAAGAFREFCRTETAWLDDYAFFRALMEKNQGRETWDQWREEHRSLGVARDWMNGLSAKKRANFEKRLEFFRYVQWIARQQWLAVRKYAEEHGVLLMGDVPFGVSYYSADVFARPEVFALEWSGGAPPEPYFKEDEFTQKWGQNWGMPLYRWDQMRAQNFSWWRQRIRGARIIFHVFRIDHVLGFYRIYAFPWRPTRNQEFQPLSWEEMCARTGGRTPHFAPRDDSNWENCEANRREGEEYLHVVLEEAGDTRVVGEDLGTVPYYVRPNLSALGMPGFKIPHWESHDNGRVVSGNDYQHLSVTTYATHDHKPLRALWRDAFEKQSPVSAQARHDLTRIAEFAGLPPPDEQMNFERDFCPQVLKALFKSQAWLAVLMITDLLGRKDRFNAPGVTATSNWTRRLPCTVKELFERPAIRRRARMIRQLLEETGRLVPTAQPAIQNNVTDGTHQSGPKDSAFHLC